MRTPRILSHSIVALLLAPFAVEANQDVLSGVAPAWATGGNWSLGTPPGIADNAVIAATGLVDVNGTALAGLRELQDISFNSAGGVTLINNSSTDAMVLALNGGRGAGVPLIQTTGNIPYVIQRMGSNTLGLQLKASGSISVGSTDPSLGLTISSAITESGGARSLTKIGVGRLTLAGTNTFTGGVTVSAGILEAASNGALGNGAAVINGGTLEINLPSATLSAGSITVNSGGKIAVRNGATLNNAVTLAGGTLTVHETGTGTFAGAINVTANSFADLRSYIDPLIDLDLTISGLLSGSSSLTLGGNDTGNKALIVKNTGNTFSGTFFVPTGQILRAAPATSGKTLGTGAINLSGGTLQVRDNGASIGAVVNYGNALVVQSGSGTIDVDRSAGSNSSVTIQFGALTIGQQTLNVKAGNGYRVQIGATALTGPADFNIMTPSPHFSSVTGIISGAFDFTKSGPGILRLQAANTYSGQTYINSGFLNLVSAGAIPNSPRINVAAGATFDVSSVTGGFKLLGSQTLAGNGNVAVSTSGSFTVQNGGTINPLGTAGLATLTMGKLTLGTVAGDLANVNFTNVATPPVLNIATTGALVANGGANSVTVNLSGGAPSVGTYTLINYAGTIGGTGASAFVLGTLPVRVVGASLVHNVANTSLDLNVTAIDFPIWKGALNNEWSNATLAAPKNWVLNSNNATSTDFLVNDNATFNDLAIRTTVDISVTDVVSGTVTFNNTTKDYTITGSKAIAGPGGLNKNGTGKVTIQNLNTFTGPVTLNAGTVSVNEVADAGMESALGAGSSLTFNGGALEFLGSFGSTNRTLSLSGGGGTIRNDLDLTLAGVISGAGTLTKVGSGILTLAATNTYATTNIAEGTLEIGTGGTLGTGVITNSATLSFNTFGTMTVSNVIQGSGGVKVIGFGSVTLGGASANTYTGGTEVSGGTLIAGKPAGINAIPGDLVINAGGSFRYLNNNVSNQIANTASIIINGGIFGDPNNAAPTNPGATDTVANVTVNGGAFGSGRNVTVGPFTITGTLHVLGGGVANAQRGGIISAATVQIDDGAVNLDGGSTTATNESRLDVGAGGLHLAGGTINFNTGAVAGNSVGSILRLGGNLTSTGDSFFIRNSPGLSNAIVDLLGATRTFDVEGTLTFAGTFRVQNGTLSKTGTGTLIFADSQTLGALDIEAGIVQVGAAPIPAPAIAADNAMAEPVTNSIQEEIIAGPAQAIPEPHLASLLLLGATALFGRRRRE